jgi:hypothetical protein
MMEAREKPAEQLAPRARRVRDACLRQWAKGRGLPVPSGRDLAGLSGAVSLGDAAEWWRGLHASAASESVATDQLSRDRRRAVVVRTVVGIAVTIAGLAITPGRAF